jgi:hypothetical protein
MMTLITQLSALAPQSVAPGLLITSTAAIVSGGTSCTSQNTPEKNGV